MILYKQWILWNDTWNIEYKWDSNSGTQNLCVPVWHHNNRGHEAQMEDIIFNPCIYTIRILYVYLSIFPADLKHHFFDVSDHWSEPIKSWEFVRRLSEKAKHSTGCTAGLISVLVPPQIHHCLVTLTGSSESVEITGSQFHGIQLVNDLWCLW